jgi:precorrin-3B synthase
MTVQTANHPRRRGACPGLSAPMPTGDGLLVRLMPIGTIPLRAFGTLCAAAREHGNGIVEITSRGSIQVRGLSAASAPRFADAIAALNIAADDGVPILSNALSGLDSTEIFDAGALAAQLRLVLARGSLAARLAPKVSVAIDGGGGINLDELSADVRFRAEATNSGVALRVGVGGDGTSAAQLGMIVPNDGVEAAVQLLDLLARHGHDARARDIFAAEGLALFRSALADLLVGEAPPSEARKCKAAIGLHELRDGSLAHGIGLAFGHADAASLEKVAEIAVVGGAKGMRAVPGRALMTIGLAPERSSSFAADAKRLGFIVRADDPRRRVVACAGAPICASAHIAARGLAPLITEAAAPHIRGSFTIHVSGCAKGCAHPTPAALTVVGKPEGCALIANGSSRDAAFAVVPMGGLPATIARFARERRREDSHV